MTRLKSKFNAERYFVDQVKGMGFKPADAANIYKYTAAVVAYAWNKRGRSPAVPSPIYNYVMTLSRRCVNAGIKNLRTAPKAKVEKVFKNKAMLLPPVKRAKIQVLVPKKVPQKIVHKYRFRMGRRSYTLQLSKKLKSGQLSYRQTGYARQIFDLLKNRKDKTITGIVVNRKTYGPTTATYRNFRKQYIKYFPTTVADPKKRIRVNKV